MKSKSPTNRGRFLLLSAGAAATIGAGAWYWPNRWKHIVVHHSGGNFEDSSVPEQQFDALVSLTRRLMKDHGIPAAKVAFHGKIEGGSTKCPGRNFPFDKFRQAIA